MSFVFLFYFFPYVCLFIIVIYIGRQELRAAAQDMQRNDLIDRMVEKERIR